jgi:nucleotide-binding universal stress UspA family protein
MTRKFLIGYDGTEESLRALNFAIKMKQQQSGSEQTEFHLAFVVEKVASIADPVPDELLDSLRKPADEILADGARLVRNQLETAFVHLEFGSPPQKLLELADRIKPDLVVLGIAKHPPSKKILGTVSASFFNSRKYPVLGVP